ncbi:MAG: hypothetical protein JXA71_01160 [Chitinispirillaceae bacterium]|nr:hypothetical protein [Chitinispirillaceae bacterium]
MSDGRFFHSMVIATVVIAIVVFAVFNCARNNPLDENGINYVPGSAPQAQFLKDTVSAYINVEFDIPVFFSDTAAKGGRAPLVKVLLFNWEGDSARLNDTMTPPADSVIAKVFAQAGERTVFMKAKDNDGELSPLAHMRLTILEGRPRILAFTAAPLSVYTGDTVTATATATDDNEEEGDTLDFIWRVDNTRDTVTRSAVFKTAFTTAGIHKIVVQGRDRDNLLSHPDSVLIEVRSRPVLVDSTGPEITFISPSGAITVNVPFVAVVVNTKDQSGVSLVYINTSPAELAGGTSTSSMWKRDSVPLSEGVNVIPVLAIDNRLNPSDTTITVTYNRNADDRTPPDITLRSPGQGDTVYFPQITVLAEVRDASGKVDQVTCNGRPMLYTGGSLYQTDSVAVREGPDTIVIYARDDKGNDTSRNLHITYVRDPVIDTTPPSLLILSPRKGATVETRACTVSVAASDLMSDIDSVSVNGLRALHMGGQLFARAIQLDHGANTIVVRAVDKSGNHRADTARVTQNAAPLFSITHKDTSMTTGGEASFSLSATDPDGDSLTFSFLTFPSKASVRPVFTRAGTTVTISPYRPDQTGVDTFKILVTDPYAGFDTVTIRVFITSQQETKPFFTTKPGELPDSATVGMTYRAPLAAVDPNSKPLVFSFRKPPTPPGAQIDSAGTVTWIPAAADTGTDSLFALASNGTESDTLIWTVRVIMPNLPPRLAKPVDTAIDEGVRLRITLSATDPNGDPLSYSMSSFPSGAQLAGNVFTWTPSFSQAGVYTVRFRVTETNRSPPLSDSQTVSITVRNVNHAPVLAPIGAKTGFERVPLEFTVTAGDTNGDSIRFSMTSPPQGASLTALTMTTARFSWTPTGAQAGSYTVTFLATDNGNPVMRDSETVVITMRDTVPPVFVTHPDSMSDTVFVGNTYLDTLRATDAGGDAIIYQKLAGPAWLTLAQTSGIVIGAPEPSDVVARVDVMMTAEDPVGLKDTLSWSITVLPMWPRVWGGPATNDTGCSVIEADGGYALCGNISEPTLNARWPFLMRTDNLGNPVSYKMFSSTVSKQNAYSLVQASDGGYILCGTDSSATTEQLLLLKASIKGDSLEWTAKFSVGGGIDASNAITKGVSAFATKEGGYIACGASARRSGSVAVSTPFMVKTNSSGKEEWQKEYMNNALGSSAVYCVVQTADDGYIIAGEAGSRGGTVTDTDLLIVKTDAKGDTVWTRTYHRGARDIAMAVRQTTGGYIVGGYTISILSSTITGFVLKVSEQGDTLWTRPITSAGGNSTITSIRTTPDGGFIAAGSVINATGGGEDALLVKFSSDGGEEWRKMYGGALGDRANSVTALKEGGFVFAGFTTQTRSNQTSTDVYLVKTDASGTMVEK